MVVLISVGLFWLVPEAGAFGWIWIAWILFIGALNTRRYLRTRR
jgi:hypothetical protein